MRILNISKAKVGTKSSRITVFRLFRIKCQLNAFRIELETEDHFSIKAVIRDRIYRYSPTARN